MYACEVGLTPSVKLLVDKGAKVNFQDETGATARELATMAGHDGCVAALPATAYLVRVSLPPSHVRSCRFEALCTVI
jgi:ankyrin repeat protein